MRERRSSRPRRERRLIVEAACVAILLLGRRIERTLELLNWVLVATILAGLLLLCILVAPGDRWVATAAGFTGWDWDRGGFAFLPPGADWFLLSAGAFISMIVPLAVFLALQRYFVRGLLAGSVKG